ncbi:hypothetical protein B0H14DRAFT_2342242 [Mycena olivaceomarginata]|nr:hypothetical protein B0H14DRAFT_2342242 [Mycena olivaceomarginata]
MTRPADLDATSLTTASGAQLNYWIDAANNGLPKKVLTKTGTVDIRRQRLADYYGINLSATPVTPSVGPISRDADITKRQWEHLRAVGAEWAAKDLVGTPFQLVSNAPPSSHGIIFISVPSTALLPSIKSAVDATLANMAFAPSSLSEHSALLNMDDETVQAVIESANDGDIESLGTLFKLQASLSGNNSAPFPRQITALSSHSSLSPTPTNISSADPIPSPSLPMPSVSLAPAGSDSAILSAGGILVEALKRADGLGDVISQIENGDVAKIRELYGPQTGRATNPMWTNIKGTITRRERIGQEFEREFGGDKGKFLGFFTVPDVTTGRKRKAAEPAEKLRPLRLVVEAIPHRNKDLAEEQEKVEYRENGEFSSSRWGQRWDGQNKWEIWRAIGKERYSRERK